VLVSREFKYFTHPLELDEAYENRDHDALQGHIEHIKQSGLAKHMPNELREASYRLETLERSSHLHDGIMDMDKKTMSEVRRYQNPPPMMHKVMQGTFLLLGEDEESTEVIFHGFSVYFVIL